jgi:hypothetical protein
VNSLRFFLQLSVAVWVGALVFFPMFAQVAFSTLPSVHLAGIIVRGALIELHWVGLACGIAFLALSLVYNNLVLGRPRLLAVSHVLIVLMIALTAISQFILIPKMDVLRISAGEINILPVSNPLRAQFDSLHAWSVRIEGTVLILGFGVLYSLARRFSSRA